VSYAPLDADVLYSTTIKEGPVVFAVWCAILASKDQDGISALNPETAAVLMSNPLEGKLADFEAIKAAWDVLASPDPKSKNKAHEGRRIIPTGDGRWFVVSHEKYRTKHRKYERKEANAEYQRRHRAKVKDKAAEVCAVCDGPGPIAAFGGYFCEEHAGKMRVATGVSTGGELPEGVMPPEEVA
jgi:hypothetical protein